MLGETCMKRLIFLSFFSFLIGLFFSFEAKAALPLCLPENVKAEYVDRWKKIDPTWQLFFKCRSGTTAIVHTNTREYTPATVYFLTSEEGDPLLDGGMDADACYLISLYCSIKPPPSEEPENPEGTETDADSSADSEPEEFEPDAPYNTYILGE